MKILENEEIVGWITGKSEKKRAEFQPSKFPNPENNSVWKANTQMRSNAGHSLNLKKRILNVSFIFNQLISWKHFIVTNFTTVSSKSIFNLQFINLFIKISKF